MLQLIIIGNLVRDPETGTTDGGVNWCRFTVAARKKYAKEGEPDAEFVRVTAWRGLGDNCAKYLSKGRKVNVYGEPRAHAWKSREGEARAELEMNADSVEFLTGSGGGRDAPTDADAPPERGAQAAAPDAPDTAVDKQTGFTEVQTDELPF